MTLQSMFWQLLMTIVEYSGEYSAVGNTLGNILEKDLGECIGGNALRGKPWGECNGGFFVEYLGPGLN